MAVPIIKAGTTILIPSGPTGEHLFICIFDAKEIDGKQKLLLAPIVSQFPKCDLTCALTVEDHPFIRHDSIIAYNHCRTESLDHVLNCVGSGLFKITYPPVSAAVLVRVQNSYMTSNRVPKYIKRDWS